jgi:CRP-like cAMP-binding protein
MVDAMLLNDEVQLLRQVPYFSRIDPCKLKLLAFTSARVCYHPGETIFRCGDASDSAYVIIQGTVELSVTSPSGENVVGTATSNSIIGEMCLLGDAPRLAHARAVTDVEALRIGKDCFLKVMADNPRMGIEVSRALAETLRDQAARVEKRPVGVLEPAH